MIEIVVKEMPVNCVQELRILMCLSLRNQCCLHLNNVKYNGYCIRKSSSSKRASEGMNLLWLDSEYLYFIWLQYMKMFIYTFTSQ